MHKRFFSSIIFAGLVCASSAFAQSDVLPVPKDLQLPSNDTSGAIVAPLPTPSNIPGLPSPASVEASTPPALPDIQPLTLPGEAPPAPLSAPITATETAPAAAPVMETETPVVATPVSPVPKKHASRSKRKTVVANGKIPYRNVRLPATIYKTQYDKRNMHLPTAYTENDMDALVFVAIAYDDADAMKSLLGYGKRNMNKPSQAGDTPLIAAVKANAVQCVYVLLGRHANTSAKDAQGRTASQIASQLGQGHMARIIEMRASDREFASNDMVHLTAPSARKYASPLELIK